MPNLAKCLISSFPPTSKSALDVNAAAVSSAYAESRNRKISPCVETLRPESLYKRGVDLNMHGATEEVFRQVWSMAVMKKIKRSGPSVSPCLTPIVLLNDLDISAIRKFTLTFEWRLVIRDISLSGSPDLLSTCQSSSLGTRSNAFTRSRNKI